MNYIPFCTCPHCLIAHYWDMGMFWSFWSRSRSRNPELAERGLRVWGVAGRHAGKSS